MPPAALLPGGGKHVTDRLPEPERTITDGQHRGLHAATLAVAQQVGPRLARFAEPVGERDQLLAAVGADPDDHQQAHLVLLQPDLQVDAVDPARRHSPTRPTTATRTRRLRLATGRSAG